MRYKIPLYNCYWCKCAWCIKSWNCENKNCYICRQRDKKGKLPVINKKCNDYIPEDENTIKLIREIQKCDNCKYKKLYKQLQEVIEKCL